MAAGSQEENGNWALLVMAPKIISAKKKRGLFRAKNSMKNHPICLMLRKDIIKKASPNRLVKNVSNPPLKLLVLL